MRIPKPQGEVTYLGDRDALKTWEKAKEIAREYARTKEERALLKLIIPEENNLRSWWNITDKELNLFRFAVRMLRKGESYMTINLAVAQRHGTLKSKFLRGLEFLAYKYEREAFINRQMSHWGFFGLSKEEQQKRASEYGEKLMKDFADHTDL